MSGAARQREGKGGPMNRPFSGTARGVYAEMCARVCAYASTCVYNTSVHVSVIT